MADQSQSFEHSQVEDLNLPLRLCEFVPLVASLMALNALAVDIMLPALSDIATDFALERANDQQLVVFVYILGFGAPQLFFGPVSDSYGRRRILQFSLIGYAVAGLGCAFAGSFSMLLLMRFLQGVFAAGIRVLAVSIVRDLMAGRAMARVMSLILTVFMAVPIMAPFLGSRILLVADWHWIFSALVIAALAILVWGSLRLPETLPAEKRQPLAWGQTFKAYGEVVRSRVTFGYMAASGVIFGCLFGFIASAEQLFVDVFDKEESFPLWFAAISICLALANFTNSALVEKLGMRRISHFMLLLFILLTGANAVYMALYGDSFPVFMVLWALSFGCFGMMGSNFSALALEPLGKIAGTASAAYGFATSTVASLFGMAIASRFDGTAASVVSGFVGLGILSLIIVLVTERGKLFQAR